MQVREQRTLIATSHLSALSAPLLLACCTPDSDLESRSPPDECTQASDVSAPDMPSQCLSAPEPLGNRMLSVLPWPGGWMVAGLSARPDGAYSFIPEQEDLRLLTMPVLVDNSAWRVSETPIGVHPLVQTDSLVFASGTMDALGARVVVTYGRQVFVVTPGGPVDHLSRDAPISSAVVALDSTRIALAGLLTADVTSPLSYRVVSVETGAELIRRDYSHEAGLPGVWILEFYTEPSVALVHVGPQRLLMAWVSTDRRSILGMLIGEDGSPLSSEPANLARATTDLSLPHFARVAPGRLGMVWTARSGLEVRYRTVQDDLSDALSAGIVVNAEQQCAQEDARIAPRDDGDGAIILWSTRPLRPLLGRFVDSEVPPNLLPASSDATVAGDCSTGVLGAPAIRTTEWGTLAAYNDRFRFPEGEVPTRPLIHRLAAADWQ